MPLARSFNMIIKPALSSTLSRRQFFGISSAACLAGSLSAAEANPPEGFQFAYLTDIHTQPEKGGGDGLSQCLRAVNALPSRPDFVLTGGDLIMDALDVGHDRLKVQWSLFEERWKELGMTSHHTVGNHDVGGWSAKSHILPGDADYGKQYFADHYGEGRTYRSFDHKGWHFITLDSIGQNPETRDYIGWIDEAQIEWLKNDLAKVGKTTPIIAGHNVKLVLSGHGHILERIELHGISYIQGGAVCGMWWKGPVFGNPEGFSVVTCRADCTFDLNYQGYGWKVVA